MKSGIYIRVGKEKKDLITECTVGEFKDWLKSESYYAYVRALGYEKPLENPYLRMGFLLALASTYKITIDKVLPEFNAFMAVKEAIFE